MNTIIQLSLLFFIAVSLLLIYGKPDSILRKVKRKRFTDIYQLEER